MTPELARYIRLARNRIYGTPLEAEKEKEAIAIDEFKMLLARKLDLAVRLELFSERIWRWSPQGCSLQFTVDDRHFILQRAGNDRWFFRPTEGMNTLPITLSDTEEFQDRLLIAIDDALQKRY